MGSALNASGPQVTAGGGSVPSASGPQVTAGGGSAPSASGPQVTTGGASAQVTTDGESASKASGPQVTTDVPYKIGIAIVWLLAVALQLTETGLVITKRLFHTKICNGSSILDNQQLDAEYYVYHIGAYGFMGFLRVIEFSLLARGLWELGKEYKNLWKKFGHAACEIMWVYRCDTCRRCNFIFWKKLLLIILVLAAVAHLVLGILTERTIEKKFLCLKHRSMAIGIAANVLNCVTHTLYFLILTLMTAASIAMERMLFNDTSESSKCCSCSNKPNLDGETADQQYKNNGERIRLINQVFLTWFILPVVILLIMLRIPAGTSRYRLQDGATSFTVAQELVHLLYQTVFVLVEIDNASRFTRVHKKYLRKLRELVQQNTSIPVTTVQENNDNNFTPRIGNIDTPVTTVMSIFFTLFGIMLLLGHDFLEHSQHGYRATS